MKVLKQKIVNWFIGSELRGIEVRLQALEKSSAEAMELIEEVRCTAEEMSGIAERADDVAEEARTMASDCDDKIDSLERSLGNQVEDLELNFEMPEFVDRLEEALEIIEQRKERMQAILKPRIEEDIKKYNEKKEANGKEGA